MSRRLQSRALSLIESAANVAVGFALAVVVQLLAFPAFGLQASLRQNLGVSAVFTAVSLVRGYLLRRLFNTLGGR